MLPAQFQIGMRCGWLLMAWCCFHFCWVQKAVLFTIMWPVLAKNSGAWNDMPRIGDDWPPENYWPHSSDRLGKPHPFMWDDVGWRSCICFGSVFDCFFLLSLVFFFQNMFDTVSIASLFCNNLSHKHPVISAVSSLTHNFGQGQPAPKHPVDNVNASSGRMAMSMSF